MEYTTGVSRRLRTPPRHIGFAPRGFSLAEVLVVLVIFGILILIAAPRMSLAPARTRSAANTTGSTLLAAQRAAVSRQQNVVISFDAPGKRIRVHYDANGDGVIQATEHAYWQPLPEGVVFGRAGAPAGRVGTAAVSFRGRQGGLPAVFFMRNGSASEEGGFYLATALDQSRGAASSVRMVVVDRATGRPNWQVYSGGAWKTEF
ncbi:MAG TPA: type II secretion system protein [Longimicrobium sp.]|nr:type II secretion system protein [Longimicrobium sp.]